VLYFTPRLVISLRNIKKAVFNRMGNLRRIQINRTDLDTSSAADAGGFSYIEFGPADFLCSQDGNCSGGFGYWAR